MWGSERVSHFFTRVEETWFPATCMYALYLAYMALGSLYIPGTVYQGNEVGSRKKRLSYKCNGLRLYLTAICSYIGGAYLGLFKGTIIYDHFEGLVVVVNVFVVIHSLHLYLKGKMSDRESKLYGIEPEKGNGFLLDFWLGVEVNPRPRGERFDYKFFAYRPAMTGWTLINISLAYAQLERYGELSAAMVIHQLMSMAYVFDYFWNEPKMLSTWDIIAERFGYMLVFGDYFFISFTFSVQPWFLIDYPLDSSPTYLAFSMLVFIFGYLIFRGANSQKALFKDAVAEAQKTKSKKISLTIWGRPVEYIETSRSPLLVSGFWGCARHLNYTGDLLMAFALSMPTGFVTVKSWTYFIYLLILLLHRAHRDDAECRRKYGAEDWNRYTSRVPYTFIPYLF